MAIETDIIYTAGEHVVLRVTIINETDVSSWAFSYRQVVGDNTIIKTSGNGIAPVSGEPTKIDITLQAEETALIAVAPGFYREGLWALWRTDANAEARLAYGKVTVLGSV